ncbi:MAG: DUF262 domain-containing protein, partial [Mycoplasma sp.]|nr:DUF262 domain-containing protein [Mycoplasma sp.]
MKAQLNHIQDILGHTYDKFYIPIYQRSYAWSSKQINRFILDIEFILTSKKQEIHFFGNIIYIEHKEPLERYIQKQIIDGQQRITSFFLLFYALYNNSVVDEKEFAN